MDVIDCIWSIAPSTYTGTSELNHLPKELVPSQGFQVAVPRLELTPRLLLQLGQLLQVPLSCWPGPVRVSPYSVTASSCILTVTVITVNCQHPAAQTQEKIRSLGCYQPTGTLTG